MAGTDATRGSVEVATGDAVLHEMVVSFPSSREREHDSLRSVHDQGICCAALSLSPPLEVGIRRQRLQWVAGYGNSFWPCKAEKRKRSSGRPERTLRSMTCGAWDDEGGNAAGYGAIVVMASLKLLFFCPY